MPIHDQKAIPGDTRGPQFLRSRGLKLVVTTLVCVKVVINLWRFAPMEKSYCKKRPVVYTVDGVYSVAKMKKFFFIKGIGNSNNYEVRVFIFTR